MTEKSVIRPRGKSAAAEATLRAAGTAQQCAGRSPAVYYFRHDRSTVVIGPHDPYWFRQQPSSPFTPGAV